MNRSFPISLEPEGILMLLEDSIGSIPFNIILASLLGMILIKNHVPKALVGLWFGIIVFISLLRWMNSRLSINNKYYISHANTSLFLFVCLTGLTGLAWGLAYVLFLPYVNLTYESIIILVLGGMSAGAIASLSVYLPAYYAYVLPMFLPIIIYNFYMLELDRILLGVMYVLFVVMVFVTARINYRLFEVNLKLVKEKDILINELTLMNLRLEKSMSEVKTMSITDPLTGLYNRRHFDTIFENELKRAHRESYAINLVLIDIDNFKYINDHYGHPSGDEFLVYVANSLKNAAHRPNDYIFRLGGDEFAMILSYMLPDDVRPFCESVQERFNINNIYKNVTLSMSLISTYSNHKMDMQNIITLADQTLYVAKKEGKNKIISKIIT